MIQGFDISNHQGAIDWSLAGRVGYQFGIVKCTEGTDYADPFCAHYWAALKSAWMLRGAYHFGRPSTCSGHDEADYFLAHLPPLEKGDFLVLDLEDERVPATADLLAYALDFLRTVEHVAGFKPLLYSGHYYLAPHNCEGHPESLGQFGLWLASYQTTLPTVPDGWKFFAIWQYSSHGVVPGIAGEVDLNVANVATKAQLAKYGKH